MKRIFALGAALLLTLSLAACGGNTEAPAETSAIDSMELSAVMETILTDVGELPVLDNIEITEENFSFYTFIPYFEGAQALVSEPIIGSIAHSVVLIHVPDGTDPETVAEDVRANADPRKWICVEAEETLVSTNGSYVLLTMSTADTANAINENFLAI